jgi:DNA polymerase
MTPSLFDAQPDAGAPPLTLPRDVAELVRTVVCHRADDRYAALYALVWRIVHGERHLLDVNSDPLVFRLAMMAKEVRRDIHKMHAFVRFRRLRTYPRSCSTRVTSSSLATARSPC